MTGRRVGPSAAAPRRLLSSVLIVGVLGAIAGYGTFSAFSSTTTNSGNGFSAGIVVVGDNSSGAAMYSVSNKKPGDSVQGCIKVTYTGSLAATVSLYMSSSSGTLGQYLTFAIDKVTY